LFFIIKRERIRLKRRWLVLLTAMMIFAAVVSGCAPKEQTEAIPKETPEEHTKGETITILDDFGNEISLNEPAQRIISLAPSNTEILYAIGAGDRVIGVTTFDDYPEEVLQVEKIGDFNGMNLERIIELEPDLVINYGEGITEETQRLVEAGIQIAGFEPESIEEIIETIKRIGVLTGNNTEAETLSQEMIAKEAELIEKVKGLEAKTVFYEIWHEPLMAAGPGSFVDQLILLAGGINVAGDAEREYPQFDIEQLIERNPQIYLTANDLPEKTAESIAERPGYENIDAIKNGQIYLLDGNIMSRPGPRIIEALEMLIKAIHPEIE
jgi:iron complex transport system substrate-binding protein